MFDTVYTAMAIFWDEGFGVGSRLWPLYLLATLLIGFVLFRRRGIEGSFLTWLMPRSIWTHDSHLVDIKLFAVSKILSAAGLFQTVAVAALVTTLVADLIPYPGMKSQPHPIVIALLLLIFGDFATYWVHRFHHELRILWPFHSVHHSAEVMTPVTVYRKHPVYDLTKTVLHGLVLGLAQGVLAGLFPGGVGIAMLLGVNAGYFLFNMFGANFRHSHIWLSYGRVLEHILISPAQHQIHHSVAPEHHNTNYGEVLAIWDWMFGTLFIAEGAQEIVFGLGDAQGNRLRQRHDSLTAALVVPVQDSWKQMRRRLTIGRATADRPVTPAE